MVRAALCLAPVMFMAGALAACQPGQEEGPMGQAFEWYATDSAPSDYPAYLVEAFFQLADGNIEGIPEFQINNGGWGRTGAIQIIGEDPKPVPAVLHVEWYDLVARKGYGGQIDLPSERIDDMMREGLVSPATGERMPVDFIAVGLAPGGDVALWVTSERVRHLVGMFKATPMQIPLDKLSNDPELSEAQFVEKLLDAALPDGRAEEIRSAPVPDGQWVRYAERSIGGPRSPASLQVTSSGSSS